jgi:hypothetical protein
MTTVWLRVILAEGQAGLNGPAGLLNTATGSSSSQQGRVPRLHGLCKQQASLSVHLAVKPDVH